MSISNRSGDLNELKNEAVSYFTTNADIVKKVEAGLNDLFYESPSDVYGFLVKFNFFIELFICLHFLYFSQNTFVNLQKRQLFQESSLMELFIMIRKINRHFKLKFTRI